MSDHNHPPQNPLYGLMAEFETPGQLVAAARRTREAGFKKFDAYTPYPIHELDEANGRREREARGLGSVR